MAPLMTIKTWCAKKPKYRCKDCDVEIVSAGIHKKDNLDLEYIKKHGSKEAATKAYVQEILDDAFLRYSNNRLLKKSAQAQAVLGMVREMIDYER